MPDVARATIDLVIIGCYAVMIPGLAALTVAVCRGPAARQVWTNAIASRPPNAT